MALKRNERYPNRFENPTNDHPQGAFKNRTSPTAKDGSYLEADWANDIDGFFARALNIAGVTPNGTVDTGTSSQLYDALVTALPGRLIATKVFNVSTTYTPSAGTRLIKVRQVGGGGAGGSGGTNSSTTISAGSGGGSGAYAEAFFTTIPASVNVTVGVGGTANSAGTGGAGGQTSFGTLLISPGGSGGGVIQTATSSIIGYAGQGVGGNISTMLSGVGGTALALSKGQSGTNGLCFGTGLLPLAGFGAPSPFGGGSNQTAPNTAGTNATSPGTGGSGTSTTASTSAVLAANGAKGLVIVEEYS